MNEEIKSALQHLLGNAIELAEISQSEVRVTFQSVAMVIEPGKSSAELMAEFERMERLTGIANEIAAMFMKMFSVSEIRRMVRWMPGGEELIMSAPSTSLTPKEQFEGLAMLLCIREVALTHAFWQMVEQEHKFRIASDIAPVKQRVEQEFGLN